MGFFWVLIFGPIRSSLSVEIRSTPPPLGKILVPSTDCDVISCNGQVVKRSFKRYQNEHDLVKDTGEKGKTSCNFDLKLSIKILFHYPPPFI